ncbi:MAG: alcohol dehydrogenase catalytic domain-containing protein [Chloroflexi bacterium]|nr:alcohol dehydrogenase catalytic domain-containing protein [Chloroflexota bacterium]
MKALMLKGLGQLDLVETDIPAIADNQVLIRTHAATICTSDIVDIDHNALDLALPLVIGHEGAGEIAAVGSAVKTDLRVGQRVATHPVHPCYHCEICAAGNAHLCPNMGHFGLNMPGTFAEYYVAREDRVRVVADNFDPAQASLAEPLAVCLEALEQANLQPESSLLVMGDGPFGIIMARLAVGRGIRRVTVAGWSEFRLGFARDAQTVNTSQSSDVAALLLAQNGGKPFDAVILAVASQQALDDALHCLRRKGRLVVFSALYGAVTVDLFSVHMHELEIVGACNDKDLFDHAVDLLAQPRWGELVTQRFPLAEYAQAFALARSGKDQALKVALDFEGLTG